MYRLREAVESEREAFDAFVAAAGGHPCQSWGWGDSERPRGWEPVRYVLEAAGGEIAGTATAIRKAVLGRWRVMECPWGPVLGSADALVPMLGGLWEAARQGGVVWLRLNPEVEPDGAVETALTAEGYRPAARRWHYLSTVRLDLRLQPEEILAGMSAHHRRAVRRAERAGVQVSTEGGREDFGAFVRLYEETYRRRGLRPRSRAELEAVYAVPGLLKLFVARVGGNAVHALALYGWGRRLWFAFAGSARGDSAAGQYVHWAAMRWGRERGYEEYDLGGVPEAEEASGAMGGLLRFKGGFGGRVVRLVGEHERYASAAWAAACRRALPVWRALRGLRAPARAAEGRA